MRQNLRKHTVCFSVLELLLNVNIVMLLRRFRRSEDINICPIALTDLPKRLADSNIAGVIRLKNLFPSYVSK